MTGDPDGPPEPEPDDGTLVNVNVMRADGKTFTVCSKCGPVGVSDLSLKAAGIQHLTEFHGVQTDFGT